MKYGLWGVKLTTAVGLSWVLPVYASPSPGPSASSYLSVLASLLLLIGVMLALALVYKRMNLGFPGSQAIKVISTLPLGTKERILVIEVNGKQHLIGVTPQQINHLVTLDEPLELPGKNPLSNQAVSHQIKDGHNPNPFDKILQGVLKKHD